MPSWTRMGVSNFDTIKFNKIINCNMSYLICPHKNGRDYFTNNGLMSAVRSSTNPFELSITKSIFYLSLI